MDNNELTWFEKQGLQTKEPADFETWRGQDLSELFWLTLGRYVKTPTNEGKELMKRIFYWACHSDHALSNSITHALKWANINLWGDEE